MRPAQFVGGTDAGYLREVGRPAQRLGDQPRSALPSDDPPDPRNRRRGAPFATRAWLNFQRDPSAALASVGPTRREGALWNSSC